MNIEELENKIKGLQAQLVALKNDKFTYGLLQAGDTFKYKGYEYTKLLNGRAIINDFEKNFMRCVFDNVDNNYKDSLIRHYIHSDKYLCRLDLVDSDFDCDGDTGCCELLSLDEYKANKHLIDCEHTDWWLSTASGKKDHEAYLVCVHDNGIRGNFSVTQSRRVRPAFNFADDIKVQVVND